MFKANKETYFTMTKPTFNKNLFLQLSLQKYFGVTFKVVTHQNENSTSSIQQYEVAQNITSAKHESICSMKYTYFKSAMTFIQFHCISYQLIRVTLSMLQTCLIQYCLSVFQYPKINSISFVLPNRGMTLKILDEISCPFIQSNTMSHLCYSTWSYI